MAGAERLRLTAGRETEFYLSVLRRPTLLRRQVKRIGVGPSPIPQKRFTVERLCHAIDAVMNDSAMRQNAAASGDCLQKENGISNAVAFITQWMNDN
jgi:sterol 3beta-glucosyltransferase